MNYDINKYLLIILLVWNVVTFLLMGIDKFKSAKGYWRIKESTLLVSAFVMGGFGSLFGSYFFRHKSKKMKFLVLLPIALVFNILVIVFYFKFFKL